MNILKTIKSYGFCRKDFVRAIMFVFTINANTDVFCQPDVNLKLDASKSYSFKGCGGNFVSGTDSEVTQINLATLNVKLSRVGMSLAEWEPQNDNNSASDINWKYFEARVTGGSRLEKEFKFAKNLKDSGKPVISSVWRLPKWILSVESAEVEKALWTEMLECIGSYLVYEKKHFGFEPDLFSFNEPNEGVLVKFSPENHRDFIKAAGAYFASLGLKTKLLLGDVTNPVPFVSYCKPAIDDPEAMKYVGAASYHSWEFDDWETLERVMKDNFALAKSGNLTLYVAELGADAFIYDNPVLFRSYDYALEDLRMSMKSIGTGLADGILIWELTSGFGLIDTGTKAATKRYWFYRHISNLLPMQEAKTLETFSDNPDVVFVAQEDILQGNKEYVFHIANFAGKIKQAVVTGVPSNLRVLGAFRTSEKEDMSAVSGLEIKGSSISLSLPEKSLTSILFISGVQPIKNTGHDYEGIIIDNVIKSSPAFSTVEIMRPDIHVPEVKKPFIIDGNPDDWGNIPSIKLDKEEQVIFRRQEWGGPEDLSADVYLAWDKNNFYIGAKVFDGSFCQPYTGAEVWKGDCVQVALDPYNDKSWRKNKDDYQLGFTLTSKGAQVWSWSGESKQNENIPFKASNKNNQTFYEIAIPWKEIPPMSPGEVSGFDIIVNDNDGTGRKGWIELTPGIGEGEHPLCFANLTFGKR